MPTSGTAERTVLAEVARRVDGLPLALELVAGRAWAVPVRDLLDVVEHPLDLESDEVGRDARQQSLRRTIAWSVDRLEPAGRDALLRLAVFAGAFHLPAARALTGFTAAETERVVADLVAYHLVAVERTDAGVAFRMLRTRARPGPRRARRLRCAGRDPRPARGVVRRAVVGPTPSTSWSSTSGARTTTTSRPSLVSCWRRDRSTPPSTSHWH